MNALIVTVDSLRFDVFERLVASDELPNFKKFLKKSLVFSNAYSNGPYTMASFPSILTGTHPFSSGPYDSLERRAMISEIFRNSGYTTIGIPNNPLISSERGYDRGFDIFINPWDLMSPAKNKVRNILKKIPLLFSIAKKINKLFFSKGLPYTPSEVINELLLRSLPDEKFFAWIHYMDVHHPYYPPKEYFPKSVSSGEAKKINSLVEKGFKTPKILRGKLKKLKALYEAEVKHADAGFGKLLDDLSERGQLRDTCIILTSDHGEEFLEHGAFGHTGIDNRTHFYNELLRVPLAVFWKRVEPGCRKNVVDLVCIPPTLSEIFGLNFSFFEGESLLRLKKDKPVLSEASRINGVFKNVDPGDRVFSFIDSGLKIVTSPRTELFDISKDSGEKNPIRDPDAVKEMIRRAEKYRESFKNRRKEFISGLVSEALKKIEGY